MGKLAGKVCIVTGASRGIGKDTATLFAAEGAKVVCAARTIAEGDHFLPGSVNTTVHEIRAGGGDATAVAVNLATYDECERLVQAARAAYGPVDVLVNNAMLIYWHPVAEFPIKQWLRATDVSFHAPFYLSKLVLEDMIPQRSGAIVNISSGKAIGPGRGPYQQKPGQLDLDVQYGANKAALERFTQGLASEVSQHGISVTCVSPSQVVLTPGVRHVLESGGDTRDDLKHEPDDYLPRSILLLATEPPDTVTGRVTYSQAVLKEFGWIEEAHGTGVETPGSGFAQI